MKLLLIGFVRLYQIFLAPFLRFMNGGHGHCRHDPTCSNYAIEALQVHGAIKGSALAAWRLLRCHPWGSHGYDPVPLAKVCARNHDDETPKINKETPLPEDHCPVEKCCLSSPVIPLASGDCPPVSQP